MRHTFIFITFFILACNNPKADETKTGVPVKPGSAGSAPAVYPEHGFKEVTDSVVKVLTSQAKAWNDGNIDEFMKGYWHSDSLKFITKNGIRYGYDSVAFNYKKHYNSKEKMGTLDFTNIRCTSLHNNHELVNVTGNWKVTEAAGKVQSGIFSLIFRKTGNEWKIVIDHTW